MFQSKQTLILDCSIKYLPDEVVRFHIFQKFLQSDTKKEYVTMKLRDILTPKRIALRNENNVFRKRLYSMKNCNKYLAIKLISLVLGLLLSMVYFCKSILKFKRLKDDKAFFSALLTSEAHGVQIGDCLLSLVLRSNGSKGLLIKDWHFYIIWMKFMFHFFASASSFKMLSYLFKGNKFFYLHETTYLDEAKRRILLKYRFKEIRYDFFKAKAIVMPSLYGHEIRKREYGRKLLDETKFDLEMARGKLNALVYRTESYGYMMGCDVDLKTSLKLEDCHNKKSVVIFLHAVSDAQYLYGTDCFIDLHDWLMSTLDILKNFDVNVYIKMHPSYYSSFHNYPVDKEYLIQLEDIFNVSLGQMEVNIPLVTNRKGVYFLHHLVSVVELSRKLPGFLCVTHHGTIATEASYLGQHVICSSASPYIKDKDMFAMLYETYQEYIELVAFWFEGGVSQGEQEKSLLEYMYIAYFVITPERILLYFAQELGLSHSNTDNLNATVERTLLDAKKGDEVFLKVEAAAKRFV